MGKIVKYCGKCEEGFAAKFGFCPNCGEHLEAFEMNPLNEPAQPEILTAAAPEPEAPMQNSFETLPKVKEPVVPATAAFSDNDILELDSVDVAEEAAPVWETFVPPVAASEPVNQYQFVPKTEEAQNYPHYEPTAEDESFHVTVIEAKDVQLRNGLLVGFGSLFIAAVAIAWVWSLFIAALPVFALDEPSLFAFVGPIEETPIEIDKPPQEKKEKGGGGGGGGQDSTPATKGRMPTQTNNPQNPLLMVTQMTNPTFVVRNETKGNIKREQTSENIGLTNGLQSDTLAGGQGTGGGFGNGNGRGAGNGNGLGEGNGNGSGSGNGNGNGNGDGDGDGDNVPRLTETVKPVGVTVGMKILSRPQPRYTDAARVNNVQGTVTLRVTFTASGTIGSVSPVSGLPYGLTEQAIAAAKQIRFEPPKRNGQPYAVTKTVSYTFTIY
jgi:TonB family protein